VSRLNAGAAQPKKRINFVSKHLSIQSVHAYFMIAKATLEHRVRQVRTIKIYWDQDRLPQPPQLRAARI
jgi:hypothetical protein